MVILSEEKHQVNSPFIEKNSHLKSVWATGDLLLRENAQNGNPFESEPLAGHKVIDNNGVFSGIQASPKPVVPGLERT